VNWHDLFMALIQDFDVAKLQERQAAALSQFDLDDEI
jgi:hypothetical protein